MQTFVFLLSVLFGERTTFQDYVLVELNTSGTHVVEGSVETRDGGHRGLSG